MGFTHQLRINMKVFVALAALVAVAYAEVEADAGLLYGGYGYSGYSPYAYGLGYGSYGYAAPYAYSAYASPYYGGYYGARTYGYGLGYGRYWKRAADAEPKAEADASLLYGGYGYGYAAPYAYGSYGYAAPYAYSAYSSPYYYGGLRTYGYGLGYGRYGGYWKRSADAEPEAEADASLLYGGYGYGYA